jgi:hypothetical protein
MPPALKTMLLLMLVIPAMAFAGGPWTQPASGGYAQLSFTGIFSYDGLYTENGDGITLNRNVSDMTVMGYFEFGLNDRLTVIGYVPYKIVKTSEDINPNGEFADTLMAGSLSGFGNPALAVKFSLIRGKMLLSGQVRIDAQVFARERSAGLRTGYFAQSFIPSLIVGGGTSRFYAFAEAGVRFRSNGYSDDFVANMEAGYSFFGKLWLAGAGDILQTISGGNRPVDGSEQTGLYADEQEYITYGIKLIYEISPKWGINGSIFSAGGGNLVPKTAPVTIGLYRRF